MPDKKIIEADDSGPLSLSLKEIMMIASSLSCGSYAHGVHNCLSKPHKNIRRKMDAIVHWVHNAAEATDSKIQIFCCCWV